MEQKPNENRGDVSYLLPKALGTGLVGGLFWTVVWGIMSYFKLVEVKPFRIWEIIFHPVTFNHPWYFLLIGLALNMALSLLLAWIYYVCCKRVGHWIMGTIYGLLIWVVTYIAGPFLFSRESTLQTYTLETHIGLLCLLLLYGVFIGYSVSFDYEQARKQPAK